MWIEDIMISNYKAIREMNICFQPGMNLLIGDNGAGKTSILESIAVAIGDFINGLSGVPKKGIMSGDIRIDTKSVADASQSIVYFHPILIKTTFHLQNDRKNYFEILHGEVNRRDETSNSRTRFLGKEIAQYANMLINDTASELPLFSYFSTSRLAPPKREDFGTSSKNKLNDRRCGYIGCFENNLDIKAIKSWCLKMEMAEFQQKKEIAEYQAFNELVSSFMFRMNELDEMPSVSYSRAFEDIVYTENKETLPINYLSAGYQSLLWMIMDMAFRLALLNPGKRDLKTCAGIVLIDEIDMHLHPKWQWRIAAALRETFPDIQFILATHSPIIISSCKNAALLEIDCEQNIHELSDAYAYSVSDVLTYRQGSAAIPDELKKMSKKFELSVNAKAYDAAREVLKQMIGQYGEENTLVKKGLFKLKLAGVEV